MVLVKYTGGVPMMDYRNAQPQYIFEVSIEIWGRTFDLYITRVGSPQLVEHIPRGPTYRIVHNISWNDFCYFLRRFYEADRVQNMVCKRIDGLME